MVLGSENAAPVDIPHPLNAYHVLQSIFERFSIFCLAWLEDARMYKRSLMELQQMCLFSVLETGSLTSVVTKSAISIERLISRARRCPRHLCLL